MHTQLFSLPDNHPLPSQYDVVCCNECGFVYADVTATQKDYNRFYRDFSVYEAPDIVSGGGETKWDRERLWQTAKCISGMFPDKSVSILDVGCATGGLLTALKEIGYLNICGVDPSSVCVDFVRRRGIKAYVGNISLPETLQASSKGFDLVICSHILEHIYDLDRALENISSYLRDGGIVYVEVPDAARYIDFYLSPFHFSDVEHINHFDEYSLSNLMRQKGFSQLSSGEKEIEVSNGIFYPAVFGFYKKDEKYNNLNILPSFVACEKVIKYIAKSRKHDQWPEILTLAESNEPVYIWGAGSYASRLLKATVLHSCNIKGFIDSNVKKQGSKIENIPVFSPRKLLEVSPPVTVIVCSVLYHNDIVVQLKKMDFAGNIVVMK